MRISDWSSDVCSSDPRQKAELLKSDRLFVDETTAKVLAPGSGQTKTGYLWAIVRDDRASGGVDPPAIIYSYMPVRGGMLEETLLGAYHGILSLVASEAFGHFLTSCPPGSPSFLAYCFPPFLLFFFSPSSSPIFLPFPSSPS